MDLFSRLRCPSAYACAYAQFTSPPCVVHHRIALLELNHCPNFCIARLKFPEIRGLTYCTRVACAECTSAPSFSFRAESFPKAKVPMQMHSARAARALCTPPRTDMHHRITLIEFHLCTKFGVNSSKFPRTGGPLSNKLFRSWRAQPAPLRYSNHKSIYAGEVYMLPASLALAARTVWPVWAAKELQVQNICTCSARAQCTPAPFFIRHQVGLAKVHPCIEFGVASSKFTFTGGPLVKNVFRPWRVQPTPHREGTPNGF